MSITTTRVPGVQKNPLTASSSPSFGRFNVGGFTYLELIFVILIIGTLVAMLLVRIMPAVDQAERAAVLKLEGQMRSSLSVAAAQHIARGEQEQVRMMHGMNPMELMLDPPQNYVGERDVINDVPRGSWFFHRASEALHYRPRESSSEQYKHVPLGELVFRVELAETEVAGRTELVGVRLARIADDKWLTARP